MNVVNDEYNFFEISFVADPPDRTARIRMTPWQRIQLWAFCALLSVRRWLRGKDR